MLHFQDQITDLQTLREPGGHAKIIQPSLEKGTASQDKQRPYRIIHMCNRYVIESISTAIEPQENNLESWTSLKGAINQNLDHTFVPIEKPMIVERYSS